jgi:hypothetical protein
MSTYSLRRLLGDLGLYESQKDVAGRISVYAAKVRDSVRRIHFERAQKEKREALRRFNEIIRQDGVSTLQAVCDAKFQGGLTLENVRRHGGLAIIEHGVATDSLDSMEVAKFANLFVVSNPARTADGKKTDRLHIDRSGAEPFGVFDGQPFPLTSDGLVLLDALIQARGKGPVSG